MSMTDRDADAKTSVVYGERGRGKSYHKKSEIVSYLYLLCQEHPNPNLTETIVKDLKGLLTDRHDDERAK